MNQGHKTWLAAVAVAFALCTNVAVAAQMPNDDTASGGPDASALMAFYGVSLATSPVGAVEDKAVWLAKVQGLIAQAPAWLQQNILASKTKAEFAANLAILESMQKGTLESAASAVKAVAAASANVSAKGLGPSGLGARNNLVYTALAPCRIMDTRNASFASGVQGPILGNVLKSIHGYIAPGLNWGEYGGTAASDCGLNSYAGFSINAIAIVITILDPNFSAYLGVSDSSNLSTVLSSVALNYTAGQGLSTLYIVPQNVNTIYFAMPTGLSANIIFDVVGYFATSEATALDCTTVTSTSAFLGLVAVACPAGRTLSGGGCQSNSIYDHTYQAFPSASDTFSCGFFPETSHTIGSTLTAYGLCCRVPGR